MQWQYVGGIDKKEENETINRIKSNQNTVLRRLDKFSLLVLLRCRQLGEISISEDWDSFSVTAIYYFNKLKRREGGQQTKDCFWFSLSRISTEWNTL